MLPVEVSRIVLLVETFRAKGFSSLGHILYLYRLGEEQTVFARKGEIKRKGLDLEDISD